LPETTEIKSAIRAGKVEEDDFTINDVLLQIPPDQISVSRRSFLNQWDSLRAAAPQKAKSGHSVISVSLSVPFCGNESINNRLRPLFAGLRSTPFCVVSNKYLNDQLALVGGQRDEKYKELNQTALVLTSMTFSTIPGMPDTLHGQFNFIWFNYFPYVSTLAFKTGPDFASPGNIKDSDLWKMFYQPVLKKCQSVTWPYIGLNSEAERTTIAWNKFKILPHTNAAAEAAAKELLDTLKGNPDGAMEAWRETLDYGQSSNFDLPGVQGRCVPVENSDTLISQYAVDTWAQKMKERGILTQPEGMALMGFQKGELTKATSEVLLPVLQKLTPGYMQSKKSGKAVVNENKEAINSAGAEVLKRLQMIKQAEKEDSQLSLYQEMEGFGTQASIKVGGKKISAGGYKLYRKEESFLISSSTPGMPNNGIVLEACSVTFSPCIAIIAMAGHSYPTCQFTGGYDSTAEFTMNGTNYAVNNLANIYDSWENINLRYKMVPQGIRNVFVKNDFLSLFGLSEFIGKSFDAATIPDQPGRSKAILSLTSAGIESKTRLEDQEALQQEFVMSENGMRNEVWKVLYKNTKASRECWYMIEPSVSSSKQNKAFYDLVLEGCILYNKLAKDVMEAIYPDKAGATFSKSGVWGKGDQYAESGMWKNGNMSPGVTFGSGRGDMYSWRGGWQTYSLIEALPNNGSIFGVDKLKRDVISRSGGGSGEGERQMNDIQKAISRMSDANDKKKQRLQELGFQRYQKDLSALLDKIINGEYLTLPEFEHLKIKKESLGIGQGKTAYPDFREQLSSVGSSMDATFTKEKLIDYDPDIYFWYPTYDGSIAAATAGSLIDSNLLNQAREHSLALYDQAQDSTGNFFKKSYLEHIGGGDKGPRKAIEELAKNEMAKPLYDKISYNNSTRNENEGGNSGEGIKLTVKPDPSRISTNWYDDEYVIQSQGLIPHSSDTHELWGGVTARMGGTTTPSGGKDTSPSASVGVRSGSNSDLGIEPLEFQFSWPPKKSTQTPNEYGMVCPVASYSVINEPLGVRDIGTTPFSFEGRRKSAVAHWNSPAARKTLVEAGCCNPSDFPNLSKATHAQYMAWSRDKGKKIGYVHEGVDIFGNVGIEVYCVADGVVKFASKVPTPQAGLFIEIAHPNGKQVKYTRYMHLQAINPGVKAGAKVKAGDCIAVLGRSGYPYTRPHLHFECWSVQSNKDKSKIMNPVVDSNIPWIKGKNAGRQMAEQSRRAMNKIAARSTPLDITSTTTSPLIEAINDFETRLLKGQAQRLVRAFPTFKLYFIEDDSGQRKRLAYDDFFSYNSVQSIRVIKSRKIAADLCVIELTNVSGVLSNRKFKHEDDSQRGRYDSKGNAPRDSKGNLVSEMGALDDPSKANTLQENPIASLLLQEGMDIHLKLGYSADPKLLDGVFTGKIQAVLFSDTDDLVTIVAQSHATELQQDIKGLDKPTSKNTWGLGTWCWWGFTDNATTGRIFEEMLAQPEILHFGRWARGDTTSERDLLTHKWQFVPAPEDDNIFAPRAEEDLAKFGSGIIFKELKYFIYQTTIWDIFKELELRHPNFIGSPVPYPDKYGERMTYFFGLPNQMYFARTATSDEQSAQAKVKAIAEEETIESRKQINAHQVLAAVTPMGTSAGSLNSVEQIFNKTKEVKKTFAKYNEQRLQLAKEAGFIRPFRQYHLWTGASHIVANNIKADARDVANTIVIKYPKSQVDSEKKESVDLQMQTEMESFTLKLDNALPTEDTRVRVGEFVNVNNENMARRYALSLLARDAKDIYKGDIIGIGDASIKPYDTIFIVDDYSDMVGPIDVEQVVHTFTRESGFLTEVTPDMCVYVNDWCLLSSMEALGVITEGVYKKVWGEQAASKLRALSSPYSTMLSAPISAAMGAVGLFVAKKILNYTPWGEPITMNPLLHHGRPFTGGIPTRKMPASTWSTLFGEWKPEADLGYDAWFEDTMDNIVGTLKKWTGRYAVGTIGG